MHEPMPPAPPPRRSRIALYIVLGVLAGLVAVGVGGYTLYGKIKDGISAVQADGNQVAGGVLGRFRDGTEAAIWDEAAPEFQQAVTREQLASVFATVRQRVGRPVSWQVTGVNKGTYLTAKGKVTSTTFTYRVTHEQGTTTATVGVDGHQRLLEVNFNFGQ